jgi:hypothetical protein
VNLNIDQNILLSSLLSTLTVHGSLIWDISKPNIELRAYGIVVEEGGLLQIGSAEEVFFPRPDCNP